jgi:hypothetical protein
VESSSAGEYCRKPTFLDSRGAGDATKSCFSARLLPHENNDTIGPDVFVENFAAGEGNDPIHFFRHLVNAEEAKLLAGGHAVQTCPHVFIAPSTILAIVYIDSYTFSHHFPDYFP